MYMHIFINMCTIYIYICLFLYIYTGIYIFITVPDPSKGVCVDPVNGGAILGKGGPDPQGGNKERQLSPDKGKDKT